MPIRAIDVYVRELRLMQDTRVSALGDTRLGIEGHSWLRQLMSNTRDGDNVAMDGLPHALEAAIVSELQFFCKHNITPIFVFNGLSVARKDMRPFAKDDHRPAFRNSAWEAYSKKHTEQAQRGWSTSSPHAQSDMIPFVMQVLQANGAEFMRAPYSSWGQLAYLYKHESQPIHAVYSSLDMLMFDVDRIITAFNHSKATFTWIQREHLLNKCGVTSEQVLDMCILAGFDWCQTFPALVTDIGFSFKSAVDATRAYRTGFNAIQMIGDHTNGRLSSYNDSFLRAYCTVKYHIVMYLDGTVGPLNAEFAPNDLHDIIGYRLPTAAYQLLAQGIVNPPVLNMLVSGSWLEFAPADNGEAAEYRKLITEWERSIYRQQCAALCGCMGPFYKQRKITMLSWFDPQSELVLNEAKAAKYSGQNAQQAASQPLQLLLQAGQAAGSASISIEGVLASSKELLLPPANKASSADTDADRGAAGMLLSVLADMGFVARNGQHTPLGSALGAGLRALNAKAPLKQWAVVEAAVLLSQGLLTGDKWSVAYEDEQSPVGKDAQQQKFVRIISRIAMLVPCCERKGPWRLAYNRDLLAFGSAVRLVQKVAANCMDSACLIQAIAATGEAPREWTAWLLKLKAEAPVECASSAASGLLVHALLADYVRSGPGSWARIQECAGDSIVAAQQVVRDASSLVDAVLAMAKEQGSGVGKGFAADLKAARDWVQPIFSEVVG
ncbi:hypothetical protein GGF37_001282 [Kickxella alabastrina]|nr:hypothetical protein GGF37_001282 [Kickxella alabastrina]